MPDVILLEASKRVLRYKCPYCDKRDTKENLLTHIEDVHADLIPAGYTPARVLFNSINKKEKGTCVCGCGRETEWNETFCRYERFSPDPACKQRYIKTVNERKARKYGDWNLAKDPEFQKKMLAHRRISGTYDFKGVDKTYTGSFEKKILVFLDKVMDYEPKDVDVPGPTIRYKYNGEWHDYITDIYIVPFNLIIEVKDGGDNPNNREMTSYREKQIEKEKQIISDGEYNYVRVTNNQFDQLLAVLAELKMQFLDDDYKHGEKIVRINESMEPITGSTDEPVMVHYQNTITNEEGLLMATDSLLENVYTEFGFVPGSVVLRDCNYSLYGSVVHDTTIPEHFDSSSIFEAFTGHTLYSLTQVPLDKNLVKLTDVWGEIENSADTLQEYMQCNDQLRQLDAINEQLSVLKGGF